MQHYDIKTGLNASYFYTYICCYFDAFLQLQYPTITVFEIHYKILDHVNNNEARFFERMSQRKNQMKQIIVAHYARKNETLFRQFPNIMTIFHQSCSLFFQMGCHRGGVSRIPYLTQLLLLGSLSSLIHSGKTIQTLLINQSFRYSHQVLPKYHSEVVLRAKFSHILFSESEPFFHAKNHFRAALYCTNFELKCR